MLKIRVKMFLPLYAKSSGKKVKQQELKRQGKARKTGGCYIIYGVQLLMLIV